MSYSPLELFDGVGGLWWNRHAADTLRSGASQANAGQTVSEIIDSSGNGASIAQSIEAQRPILNSDGTLQFDGANDNFVTGMASNSIARPFTFVARVTPNAINLDNHGAYRIITRVNGASSRGSIAINSGGAIRMIRDQGNHFVPGTVALNETVNIIAVFGESGMACYINGAKATSAGTVTMSASADPIRIGAMVDPLPSTIARPFSGKMHEFMIINRLLDDAQAADLDNYLTNGFDEPPVGEDEPPQGFSIAVRAITARNVTLRNITMRGLS